MTTLGSLPPEIKLKILSFLSLNEQASAALISLDWFQTVLGRFKSFTTIELLEHFETIARLYNQECGTKLLWFDLFAYTCHLRDASIYADCDEMLSAFGNHNQWLHKLHICELHMSKSFIDINPDTSDYFKTSSLTSGTPLALINAACLKELSVEYPVIGTQWYKAIPPTVAILRINFPNFRDSVEDLFCLDYICQEMSNVEEFSFVSNFHAKGFLREKYKSLNRLRKLYMAAAIPSAAVQPFFKEVASALPLLFFKNCPTLEEFNFGFPCVNRSWYKAVPENIRSLHLRNVVYRDNVHEDFAPHFLLQNPSTLTVLRVTEFIESAVAKWENGSVTALLNLKSLQITTGRIPDSCVMDIVSNSSIEHLNLSNVNVSAFSDLIVSSNLKNLEMTTYSNFYKPELLKCVLRNFPNLKVLVINARLCVCVDLQELLALVGHLNAVHLRIELDFNFTSLELNDSMFQNVLIRIKKQYTPDTWCLELMLEKGSDCLKMPFIDEEDVVYVKGRFSKSSDQKAQIADSFSKFILLASANIPRLSEVLARRRHVP